MRFSEIYGNKTLGERLRKMVDEDRLGHALLFVEQEGMGALAFAIALSQYLNCSNHTGGDSCGECPSCNRHQKLTYPDLHFAFPVSATSKLSDPEKKHPISNYFLRDWSALTLQNPYFCSQELTAALGMENKSGVISVNEAREITNTLSLQPFESQYKIVVIWEAEKMNIDAANKLLKLLEEPPAGTLFLLVTHKVEKMLATIISRCQVITLQPMERGEMAEILSQRLGISGEDAQSAAAAASGSIGKAFAAAESARAGSDIEDLVIAFVEAAASRSLSSALKVSDSIAALGRDRQRQWCISAEELVRKMFCFSQNLEQIAFAGRKEAEFIKRTAPGIKKGFYSKAFMAIDAALRLIDANVNAKLIFADLADRFYIYI